MKRKNGFSNLMKNVEITKCWCEELWKIVLLNWSIEKNQSISLAFKSEATFFIIWLWKT